jgi:hypothetical protein
LQSLGALSVCLIMSWAVLAQAQQDATRPANTTAPPTPPTPAAPADKAPPEETTARRKRGAPALPSPAAEPQASPEGQSDLIDVVKPQKGTNLSAKPEGRRD